MVVSRCESFRVEPVGHLLEAEKIALHRHAEDVEHGARPEDHAIGDVPVPHAALAAVEGLVEARRGNAEHGVGLRRPRRLPVEGAAQHHQHEQGDHKERRHACDALAPRAEHILLALEDDEAAGKAAEALEGDEGIFATGEHQRTHLSASCVGIDHEIRRQNAGHFPANQELRLRQGGDHDTGGIRHGEDAGLQQAVGGDDVDEPRCRHGLSRALFRLGGKIVERDALGHDLAIDHREPVLFGEVAGAALHQLQEKPGPQHGEEQHDQGGNEAAEAPFRDRQPEALGKRERQTQRSLLEKQLADLSLAHNSSPSRAAAREGIRDSEPPPQTAPNHPLLIRNRRALSRW